MFDKSDIAPLRASLPSVDAKMAVLDKLLTTLTRAIFCCVCRA